MIIWDITSTILSWSLSGGVYFPDQHTGDLCQKKKRKKRFHTKSNLLFPSVGRSLAGSVWKLISFLPLQRHEPTATSSSFCSSPSVTTESPHNIVKASPKVFFFFQQVGCSMWSSLCSLYSLWAQKRRCSLAALPICRQLRCSESRTPVLPFALFFFFDFFLAFQFSQNGFHANPSHYTALPSTLECCSGASRASC